MKELTAILEDLGYQNIQTYIQSGNVIFRSKKKAGKQTAGEISKYIFEKKGFEPKVLLLTPEQLQDSIENNPFPTDIGKALHFFFLKEASHDPDIQQLMLLKTRTEEFELINRVFYLYTPEGMARSKLAAAVEKAMGVAVTARNWNTVRKLADMAEV